MSDGGGNLAQSAAGCVGSPGDARLGALIANGGVPLTLALGAGSDAIDRVPASAGCPATDARGALRPVGAACDAGAFEVAPPLVTTGAATASGSTARIEGAVDHAGARHRRARADRDHRRLRHRDAARHDPRRGRAEPRSR